MRDVAAVGVREEGRDPGVLEPLPESANGPVGVRVQGQADRQRHGSIIARTRAAVVGACHDRAMTSLQELLEELYAAGRVPGAVALVQRGGGEPEIACVGERTVGGEAMTRDSLFRIASITKPIVAAATMVLVERGVLGLDDAVGKWLPELADPMVLRALDGPVEDVVPAERAITVRDLLTFQAGHGFPANFDVPVVQLLMERLGQGPPQPQMVPAPDEWMARLGEIPLLHQPGQGWTYNTGSDILGVLLARAAGTTLGELLAEAIFEPLGMGDTAFWARGHRTDDVVLPTPGGRVRAGRRA